MWAMSWVVVMGERERRSNARDLRASGRPWGPPSTTVTWSPRSSWDLRNVAKDSLVCFGPMASRMMRMSPRGIASSISVADFTTFSVSWTNFLSRRRNSSPIAAKGPRGRVPTVMKVSLIIRANLSAKTVVEQWWIAWLWIFLTVVAQSYTISPTLSLCGNVRFGDVALKFLEL